MLQQQQQAAMRAQQQLQQRQAQGQQPGARGQQGDQAGPGAPGAPGAPGGQAARLAQQQALQAQLTPPQLPQAGVRIYPNPRDRTLILRAETSQYPQIEELLATIDQPKPIDSFMRTYPLKNLNATEVEEILREMLGVGKDGGRSKGGAARTPGAAGSPGPSSGPGDQLPQTILQDTVTGSSPLGVDPADIKLFSSEVSNTVMAMAPKKALDFIGELINKLESEDIPQRVTKYYELKHADVEDAAAYLESHFEEASGARKPRKGGGDAAAAGSGGKSLNTPSFVPYPRLNFLTVQATAVQIEEIDKIVERIDVSGGTDKWEDVVLAYADAKLVADTLTKMFTEKSGGGTGPSKATSKGAAIPKFIGEEGGGIVLF
ncbi:MAG: secretin N-terminal domain-containing protein, partial [Planctomycetota bacterium]